MKTNMTEDRKEILEEVVKSTLKKSKVIFERLNEI